MTDLRSILRWTNLRLDGLCLAGLVWSLRPNDIDVQLLTASRQLMQNIESETGIHPGWINNGGLFIASNKERLDEYKRLQTVMQFLTRMQCSRICIFCFFQISKRHDFLLLKKMTFHKKRKKAQKYQVC